MKAKTKTKALLMSLCAVLLVAASVLGTMAYLTDSEEVNNTFTVGNVAIKLDEAKVDDMGNLVKNQDGTLADRVTQNAYKLLPGHTYVKDPTVTVLEPSVASYVRMKVTFNKASALIAMCTNPDWEEDAPTEIKNAWPLLYMVNFTDKSVKWDGIIMDNMFESENMLNNTKYCVYDKAADTLTFYYYYTETVAAIDADVKLATLFDSIKVPEWATNDQLKALQGFEINVVAEAIQADGFKNADAAWDAFAAQQK